MKKYQLFAGQTKETASGIGGIILLDNTNLAIPSVPLDTSIGHTRYFVNFENLKSRLREIVEFHIVEDIAPYSLPLPPYVYHVSIEIAA